MRRAPVAVVMLALAVIAVIAGCGDDGDDAGSSGTTLSTEASTTSTTSTEVTTTAEVTTSTAPACPDEAPIPAGATDVQAAPVVFDGDGDGADDALSVFRFEGDWWVQAAWAAGGGGAVTIDDADLGARPLGGHDLDGDGTDEAWVAIAGPASGSIIGVFRTVGCGLQPVLDGGTGQPFRFPVTHSLGAFSGARCEPNGVIALVQGPRVDDVNLLYEASETAYTYDASTGAVTTGTTDVATVDSDEVGTVATLACGDLAVRL